MPQFTVNPHRHDPYKNFKFRVRWADSAAGEHIAGISKCSALKRTTEVISYRNGSDPGICRKMPGRTNYEPITLERGVTHDLDFEAWANRVFTLGRTPGEEMALKNFRRDVIIELHNEAGQLVLAYLVLRCWVSEYQSLPELDANSGAIAIQSITIQNEGWERIVDISEPVEPSFAQPPT